MTDDTGDLETRRALSPLVNEMIGASNAGFYFPALITALTLPDVVAALGSEDGRTSRSKYTAWVMNYLEGHKQQQEADDLYGFRCSMLHQASPWPHGGGQRVAFTPPNVAQAHNFSVRSEVDDSYRVTMFSVPLFVNELVVGIDRWLGEYAATARVVRNLQRVVVFRPDGLPPHLLGPMYA
jgi:hypothetical protein